MSFPSIQRVSSTIKHHVLSTWYSLKDYQSSRHLIVFESDDWGSIRMSNKKAWEELSSLGYAVDKRPYERLDTLESAEDLEALFEVLSKYKDCKGNHPVITANMLMANPDFERIRDSGFHDYYYEPIATTYERYFGNAKVIDLMHQGYESGVFMPQSHGREHFNVAEWMQGLQAGDEDLLTAFNYGMCGIAPKVNPERGNQIMAALKASNGKQQQQINGVVEEGLQMFEQFWGFKSKSFVAPCYCWSEQIERVLFDRGVSLIQTSRAKNESYLSPAKYYYSGQHNNYNQVYSIRNCTFEPATNEGGTTSEDLMKQVSKSFANHKISVFSTHRINFVSGIVERNRAHTLRLLDEFLNQLLKNYPDVEFLSSNRLIDIL